MATKTELAAAYAATTYRVFLPGGSIDLRIGQKNDALLDWMEAESCDGYAILTAHNPGSQPVPDDVNAERQSQLEIDLLEGNYEPYAAQNIADAKDWPVEESCFVPDLAPDDACALADDYSQLAVICGGSDGVPTLVWVEEQLKD